MKKVFMAAAMTFLAMGVQAQNLVKNGNFDTPLNNEKTYASIPSTEDWFAFDKTNGQKTGSHSTKPTEPLPSVLPLMTRSMAMPYRLKRLLTIHGTRLIWDNASRELKKRCTHCPST